MHSHDAMSIIYYTKSTATMQCMLQTPIRINFSQHLDDKGMCWYIVELMWQQSKRLNCGYSN